jgi:hypothetical protein
MKKLLSIIALAILLASCSTRVDKVYRYYMGRSGNYDIWIIDGNQVRRKIFSSFLYGGNEQRYPFNPKGEIWIDNAISCEEYYLTLAHELNERHLMARFGWTYYASHDSSLSLEQVIRHRNEEICRAHEDSLNKVSVLDYQNVKEIKTISDSIRLENIYRVPAGERDGLKIWIVDGYAVRKNIYPDFGFSGNDLAYHFIPPNEIWIDGQVSCEETEYSINTELNIRKEMAAGKFFDDAWSDAIDLTQAKRQKMYELAMGHFKISIPDSITMYSGTIDGSEPDKLEIPVVPF